MIWLLQRVLPAPEHTHHDPHMHARLATWPELQEHIADFGGLMQDARLGAELRQILVVDTGRYGPRRLA